MKIQLKGHWLLLYVLVIINHGYETKPNPLDDGNENFDQFGVKFCLLNKNMGEVMILVLMLDLCFKSSWVVDNSRAWKSNSFHY